MCAASGSTAVQKAHTPCILTELHNMLCNASCLPYRFTSLSVRLLDGLSVQIFFSDNVLFNIFYIYSTKINLDLYFRLASFIFSLVSMTKANVFAHYIHDGKFCLFLFDL